MHKIWNVEQTEVWLTGATVDPDPCFEGIARRTRVDMASPLLLWKAVPPAHGYAVEVKDLRTGKREEYEFGSFNLGLSVALAVKRF